MPTFNDDGTITFGDTTLSRPTIGQLWKFEDLIGEKVNAYREDSEKLAAEIETYDPDADVPEDLARKIRDFNRRGLLENLRPWYATVFEELGEPLPSKIEDWPTEMLDIKLPARIVAHWKSNPKASGEDEQ